LKILHRKTFLRAVPGGGSSFALPRGSQLKSGHQPN
jgi:hypothetical protein